jgi:hypothetical protein
MTSSRIMALGTTKLLTEMSKGNIPGGKGWLVNMADSLTDNYEPSV